MTGDNTAFLNYYGMFVYLTSVVKGLINVTLHRPRLLDGDETALRDAQSEHKC